MKTYHFEEGGRDRPAARKFISMGGGGLREVCKKVMLRRRRRRLCIGAKS